MIQDANSEMIGKIVLRGKSELRSPLLAKNFFLIKYIEQWGTGTNRMIDWCLNHGLLEPLFEEISGSLVVTFRGEITEEYLRNLGLNQRQIKAIKYLKEHGKIDRKTYCDICEIEKTVAHEELSDMVKKEIIKMAGKGRGAHYSLRI